jgi:hypothetical protein
MEQAAPTKSETIRKAPVVSLELEGRDGQKPIQVPVVVRTRAAALITLDIKHPEVWLAHGGLKGRQGKLCLDTGGGDAPLELSGVVTSVTPIFEGNLRPRLGFKLAGLTPASNQTLDDLVPYFAPDLKTLWARWDDNRRRQPVLSSLNLSLAAGALILTGAAIAGMGLSFSRLLGGLMMLAGSFIGIGASLKTLRQKRRAKHWH